MKRRMFPCVINIAFWDDVLRVQVLKKRPKIKPVKLRAEKVAEAQVVFVSTLLSLKSWQQLFPVIHRSLGRLPNGFFLEKKLEDVGQIDF